MKERPILFRDPMVRALLAGTKTQTRRGPRGGMWHHFEPRGGHPLVWNKKNSKWEREGPQSCPYGQPGDRLWVREAWCNADILFQGYECDPPQVIGYRADMSARIDGDNPIGTQGWNWKHKSVKWRSSIFMPRWASRITLEITGVRIERLQDISEADAIAEGCEGHRASDGYDIDPFLDVDPVDEYRALWKSLNGAGSWDANPFVWVVEFRRLP